jgi:hypothetical protein
MRDKYPANWKDIRSAILDRSGDRCEKCGAPNGVSVWRRKWGELNVWSEDRLVWHSAEDGHEVSGVSFKLQNVPSERCIRIMLTCAHLDHDPAHNDPSNLRAWCQRCHVLYDAEHHRETRARRLANFQPFVDVPPECP